MKGFYILLCSDEKNSNGDGPGEHEEQLTPGSEGRLARGPCRELGSRAGLTVAQELPPLLREGAPWLRLGVGDPTTWEDWHFPTLSEVPSFSHCGCCLLFWELGIIGVLLSSWHLELLALGLWRPMVLLTAELPTEASCSLSPWLWCSCTSSSLLSVFSEITIKCLQVLYRILRGNSFSQGASVLEVICGCDYRR